MSSLQAFLKDFNRLHYSVDEIVDRYTSWVDEVTYMILTKWNKEEWRNDVFAVKSAKRGNDVYCSRTKRKFKGICKNSEEIVFFNPKDRAVKRTTALWVTLTYDTKLCSFADGWLNVGVEFNRFMACARKQFGKVSCCRVFESYDNGYPHIHCILLFQRWFSVFRDSKGNFRVHEKDVLAKGWHSNIDVKAMSSLSGGLSYLKKYLLKGINRSEADSKGLKTLALCWTYRKRAFSVSGQFRNTLSDLISNMHNSNKKTVQTTLSGKKIPEERYFLLGFMSAKLLDINCKEWFVTLSPEQSAKVSEHFEKHY